MNSLVEPLVPKNTGLYKRDKELLRRYVGGQETTESIAKSYGITPRQVQRVAQSNGVSRTISESNKLIAPLKNFKYVAIHIRKKRKQISRRVRYAIISTQPWCTMCGNKVVDGVKLEIDHIDGDPANNVPGNLQVLCHMCNAGKN